MKREQKRGQDNGSCRFSLKIEGVDGESKDSKYRKAIDILSWNWGEQNSGSMAVGGGGGAGKVAMQDFNFTMLINRASPTLFIACADGRHFKYATLICRKAGHAQQEFLIIDFKYFLVSSYQAGAVKGSGLIPVDSFSINFKAIRIRYRPQKADGWFTWIIT